VDPEDLKTRFFKDPEPCELKDFLL